MAEKKKMSVAEILAAARKADGAKSGGEESAPKAPPAAKPAEASAPEEAAPASDVAESKPAAPAKPAKPAAPAAGGKRSTADILAMARAGAKPAAAEPVAEKPKPAPKADKPAAAAAPAKAAREAAKEEDESGIGRATRDTASILAAARKESKPGPMSKAEAQARGVPATAPREAKPKLVVPPMPAKPAYAQKPAPKAEVDEDRRGVLMMMFGSFLGIGFVSLTATSALWTLGTARFMFPNVLTEPPSRFKVGFPADFAPGQVETKFVAKFGVWVVNGQYQGQQEIYALRTVCTHLGCTPNWLEAEQKFKCPCHGSGFYKDGINFEGPAPRPLERYAIKLADDGQIEIDKSKMFQEELGQWANPACFIPV